MQGNFRIKRIKIIKFYKKQVRHTPKKVSTHFVSNAFVKQDINPNTYCISFQTLKDLNSPSTHISNYSTTDDYLSKNLLDNNFSCFYRKEINFDLYLNKNNNE